MITNSDLEISDQRADLVGDEADEPREVLVIAGGVQDDRIGAGGGPRADRLGGGVRVAGRGLQVQDEPVRVRSARGGAPRVDLRAGGPELLERRTGVKDRAVGDLAAQLEGARAAGSGEDSGSVLRRP